MTADKIDDLSCLRGEFHASCKYLKSIKDALISKFKERENVVSQDDNPDISYCIQMIVQYATLINRDEMPENLGVNIKTLWTRTRMNKATKITRSQLSKDVAHRSGHKWYIVNAIEFLDFCFRGKITGRHTFEASPEQHESNVRVEDDCGGDGTSSSSSSSSSSPSQEVLFDVCSYCDIFYDCDSRLPLNFLCGCTICKQCASAMTPFLCKHCNRKSDVKELPVNSFARQYIIDKARIQGKRRAPSSEGESEEDDEEEIDDDTSHKRPRTNAFEEEMQKLVNVTTLYQSECASTTSFIRKLDSRLRVSSFEFEKMRDSARNHYDSVLRNVERDREACLGGLQTWLTDVQRACNNRIVPLRSNIEELEKVVEFITTCSQKADETQDIDFVRGERRKLQEKLRSLQSSRSFVEPSVPFVKLKTIMPTPGAFSRLYNQLMPRDRILIRIPKDQLQKRGYFKESKMSFVSDEGVCTWNVYPYIDRSKNVHCVVEMSGVEDLKASSWSRQFHLEFFDVRGNSINRQENGSIATKSPKFVSATKFHIEDKSVSPGFFNLAGDFEFLVSLTTTHYTEGNF